MWIPTSVEEIERVVQSGNLNESETFDAKKELPSKNQNKDIAKDIVAMANDGGVLLYGIDEDANGRPTVLNPILLDGAAERIQNVILTSVSEPPNIQVKEFHKSPTAPDGYLLVIVPQSPRAPHMVTVDKEYRYYLRFGKVSVPMPAGDVERMFQRRQYWEKDIITLLEARIESKDIPTMNGFSHIHLLARPLSADSNLVDRAIGAKNSSHYLGSLVQEANKPEIFPRNTYPTFEQRNRWLRKSDGWSVFLKDSPDITPDRIPINSLDMDIDDNGTAWLYYGRVGEGREQLQFFEDIVAHLVIRFCKLLAVLYTDARFLGSVDLAVAIEGLRGATSSSVRFDKDMAPYICPPYKQAEYYRGTRTTVTVMMDNPKSPAKDLVGPLIRTINQDRYDPFA